jgi:hypothetical protein
MASPVALAGNFFAREEEEEEEVSSTVRDARKNFFALRRKK